MSNTKRSRSCSEYDDADTSSNSSSGSVPEPSLEQPQQQQSPLESSSGDEMLEYVLLTREAHAPSKATPDAAGFDLHSPRNYEIPPRGYVETEGGAPSTGAIFIPTDLSIRVPVGCYGRIAPRSGMAAKFQIDVLAGTVDRDYRGNVSVGLINHGTNKVVIYAGDRIAQLIPERISYPKLVERKSFNDTTKRGANGFGSSGV